MAKRHLVETEEVSEADAERIVDDFLSSTAHEIDVRARQVYDNDGYTVDGYDPNANYDPDHDEVEHLERLSSCITD